jgi:hypothetical protein
MGYQVRPDDVYVLDSDGRAIEPPPGKIGGWLRRYRLRLAVGLGAVEAVLLYVWGNKLFGSLLALILAITAVYLYMRFARSLRSQVVRQLAWIVAFGQGIAALVPIVAGLVVFGLVVFGVIALLVLLMLLLRR